MKNFIFLILLTITSVSYAETFYYGKPATISGKLLLIKSTHPNQETFGGNEIAVTLDNEINVDGEEGLVKTRLIQLVDTDMVRYNLLYKKHGNHVKVNCQELFRAHTGHHTTKVLCFVDSAAFK